MRIKTKISELKPGDKFWYLNNECMLICDPGALLRTCGIAKRPANYPFVNMSNYSFNGFLDDSDIEIEKEVCLSDLEPGQKFKLTGGFKSSGLMGCNIDENNIFIKSKSGNWVHNSICWNLTNNKTYSLHPDRIIKEIIE